MCLLDVSVDGPGVKVCLVRYWCKLKFRARKDYPENSLRHRGLSGPSTRTQTATTQTSPTHGTHTPLTRVHTHVSYKVHTSRTGVRTMNGPCRLRTHTFLPTRKSGTWKQ